jgi:hypothetical protein
MHFISNVPDNPCNGLLSVHYTVMTPTSLTTDSWYIAFLFVYFNVPLNLSLDWMCVGHNKTVIMNYLIQNRFCDVYEGREILIVFFCKFKCKC